MFNKKQKQKMRKMKSHMKTETFISVRSEMVLDTDKEYFSKPIQMSMKVNGIKIRGKGLENFKIIRL